MPMRRMANGETSADFVSRNSAEPSSFMTSTPGINLSESSFGVDSVWMNIERTISEISLNGMAPECACDVPKLGARRCTSCRRTLDEDATFWSNPP